MRVAKYFFTILCFHGKYFICIFRFLTEIYSQIDALISRTFVSFFLTRYEDRYLRHIALAITQPEGRTIGMSAPGRGKSHGGHHQPTSELRKAFLRAN